MKTLGSILAYFHESGTDDIETFYDLNEGYDATYCGSHLVVIGVHDKSGALTFHLEDEGERHVPFSDLDHVDVFKLTKVA